MAALSLFKNLSGSCLAIIVAELLLIPSIVLFCLIHIPIGKANVVTRVPVKVAAHFAHVCSHCGAYHTCEKHDNAHNTCLVKDDLEQSLESLTPAIEVDVAGVSANHDTKDCSLVGHAAGSISQNLTWTCLAVEGAKGGNMVAQSVASAISPEAPRWHCNDNCDATEAFGFDDFWDFLVECGLTVVAGIMNCSPSIAFIAITSILGLCLARPIVMAKQ